MQFVTTFILLSLAGLVNALYLAWKHYAKKPLVCPIGDDCAEVVETRWAKIFGVRNDVLGTLFFAGLLVVGIGLAVYPQFTNVIIQLLVIATGLGVLFSIFLMYVQKFIIKKYCFYCVVSALITILLFINSFAL